MLCPTPEFIENLENGYVLGMVKIPDDPRHAALLVTHKCPSDIRSKLKKDNEWYLRFHDTPLYIFQEDLEKMNAEIIPI